MLKKYIPFFLMFSLAVFYSCGEPANNNGTETQENVEEKVEKKDEKTILGKWRYEENAKNFEEWTFSEEEFLHQGGGAMDFKEKGIYSIEDLKEGRASLVLTDIQGNMGSDDRTIIINVGDNKDEVTINNLVFKRVDKK